MGRSRRRDERRVRGPRWLLASVLALSACCTHAPSEVSPSPTVVAAPAPQDVSETASDRVVTERIRTLFREDFEIARVQADVGIATRESAVTLTGRVETDRQRLVMAAHARATEGVTRVDDQIALTH